MNFDMSLYFKFRAMGTPPRQGGVGEKVDSNAVLGHTKKTSSSSSSSPASKQPNRRDSSPSTPSCRSSLRKLRVHQDQENVKIIAKSEKSPVNINQISTKGVGIGSPSVSLLLGPRVVGLRTRSSFSSSSNSQTLIPYMDSLPVIEEKSRFLRKSPRTSITKPKLSPRNDAMSPRRPSPPPWHCNHRTTTTVDAIDERRSRKSPRRSSITKPTLSPKKGPISPILPPRTLRAIQDAASYFNDFTTLTPIILYGDDNGRKGEHTHTNHHHHPHPPQSAPINSQHYHQSPHWSGQVRVNPFSPVPEQYLRPPPTSVKSATRESRKRQHHTSFNAGLTNNVNGGPIDPPILPAASTFELIAPPPEAKKARLHNNSIILPRRDTVPDIASVLPNFDNIDASHAELIHREISPTDVMTQPLTMMNTGYCNGGSKPPPQSMDSDAWANVKTNSNSNHAIENNRMQIKRGRYLEDFQEVEFLGAGSFGSVYACLSRLDGCMYALKSITPTRRSSSSRKGNAISGHGQDVPTTMGGNNEQYLYGKCSSSVSSAPSRGLGPPSPQRRKKSFSRTGTELDTSTAGDDCNIKGNEGSRHWNDCALRRVLHEVFALAALCQKADFRTFHIVRYQQAWLEEDGTLYIQTELCTATLRDEMSGLVEITDDVLQTAAEGAVSGGQRINVFRQVKILREVLLALELVHQQGMVHLDIKVSHRELNYCSRLHEYFTIYINLFSFLLLVAAGEHICEEQLL